MSKNLSDQSVIWLNHSRTRLRRPVKPATLRTYDLLLSKWIVPSIGHEHIADFGVAKMKQFISTLASANLSPKTITLIVGVTKSIISSCTDDQGEPLYPRVWDNERIDLPIIDKSKQHTPCVTAQQIESAVASSRDPYRHLYILLAASGLRIGEALALRCRPHPHHSHFYATNAQLVIKTSIWRGTKQSPKTPSAIRTVELHSQVSRLLSNFAGGRDGFLFGNGRPMKEFTARGYSLRRNLPGFHAFRRFRITHLRSQQVPENHQVSRGPFIRQHNGSVFTVW